MNAMRDDETTSVEHVIYTCLMHREVRQRAPGICPICGMYKVQDVAPPITPPRWPASGNDGQGGQGSQGGYSG